MYELVEYEDRSGKNHFNVWLQSLDQSVGRRVRNALERMKIGILPGAKGVGHGVMEVRLNFGAGIRIYYARQGERFILLLAGGSKRRQAVDIDLAHRLWSECQEKEKR